MPPVAEHRAVLVTSSLPAWLGLLLGKGQAFIFPSLIPSPGTEWHQGKFVE